MKNVVKGALIALALVGAPIAASAPAAAASVDFSVSLGNVAFAFSDGYWDRDHHWHPWHNRAELRWYRTHHPEHFVAYRHDRDRRDRDMGWRARWW